MKLRKYKLIKNLRNKLVKKVTVHGFELENNYLRFNLQLKNFLMKKNVKSLLVDKKISREIPCDLQGNNLEIKIPFDYFTEMEDGKSSIKLFINKKLMLIKPSEEFVEDSKFAIIDGKYYAISVNKNISIRNYFNKYKFNSKKLYLQNMRTGFDLLEGNILLPVEEINKFEIYALNYNKIRTVDTQYAEQTNKITLSNFSMLSIGKWQIFVSIDNQFYPICIEHNYVNSFFNTYNHKVNVKKSNAYLYLSFKSHRLNTSIRYIKDKRECIELLLDIEELDTKLEYSLVINDVETGLETECDLVYLNGWEAKVPKNQILNSFSKKRFFILCKNSQPIKYQFNLLDSLKDKGKFKITYSSQVIKLTFYKRTDNSLGLKIKQPKIKRLITNVNDFKVKGFVTSLNQFINCQAYLFIEDRNSLESIAVPIQDNFIIDLKQFNLISIKAKDKTVMDFFIVVKDKNKKIIRKEKIKYKYSDYKKDNYYDYLAISDVDLNQHHFLITTTPFDNLKVESFSIPKTISLPTKIQKDSNTWLIGERYNTAQDNGIVLYKWLRKNTNIDAYYVIEKNSVDYEKLKGDPNILDFGSKEHYNISFKAKVLMGTHDLENVLPFKPAKGFFNYEDTFKVFLQHGVLGRKNVEYHKQYYEVPFDLFVVSSDPEKYNIAVDQLGYDENEVIVSGLARFDNLVMKFKPRDILLMPTWRDWINTDEQFLNSGYYNSYMSLINNEKLIDLLNKYNINLNFYPHYRAQNYFNKDIKNLNDRIRFISLGSVSVQDLLIKHALLITDFSSVSFDFTLMNKPVIYYHFDEKRFFRKGILRPIEETFIGGIANNEEELVELIEDRIKHGFANYDVDISEIIKYQDHSNCKRIYKSIVSKVKND
ncbi:CDP-glycerol glycerophosphotransferase family protein [Virgibacillus salexigens]|uniref:CDP-Glycerol:Poly(Glycerophosphate) glycerophosphotransferase n=1 Tax=Virgibacillus massiliensis TaxID=1462526 RepID=A0A024Q774_9BACI|nr:CDP-glycerol glycerophosphotransferase family protein [Virgibacillus massiliensis]CDQ38373.1 CDP-Glycerol:Poly(glycerophosphate) glycerophosphotransferase [Virgibacillus massiliensis]